MFRTLVISLSVICTSASFARAQQLEPKQKPPHDADASAAAEDLQVLESDGHTLLRDYLLREIHRQYDARRKRVQQALRSPETVLEYQEELRRRYQQLMGPFPEKTPLNPKVTGVIDADEYRIEKVVYESRPRFHVAANLYVPTRGDPPYPGVLVPCGHSLAGKAYAAYQSVGILLAKNGFMAMIYDPMGQGERQQLPGGPRHAGSRHKLLNVNSIPVGRHFVHYSAWDGVRSIDYLLSRPEVDRNKPVGVTGNSGGGGQTVFLMALDDRVGPAGPSCHITALERNFVLGGAGDGCQSPPNTGALGFEHPDFFWLRAPKPSIILAAERDYKDITFTRKTFREVHRAFDLLGQPDSADMFVYDDTHAFSKPRREAAVRWMRRWLLGDPRPVTEPKLRLQPEKALRSTKSGQVLQEYDDAASLVDINLALARELASTRRQFWKTHSRDECLAHIRGLLALREPAGAVSIERKGMVSRNDYRIERLVIQRNGEPPIPALLFAATKPPAKLPVTIYVDGRGKAADSGPDGAIEAIVARGRAVLSIDVRGCGETADEDGRAPYSKGDHRTAMWSLHIGRPLLGQRVEDVLTAVDALTQCSDIDSEQIELVGVAKGGPVALHAAALDSRFASVTLRRSIRSWIDDVIAKPLESDTIGSVIPAALVSYDLPDLIKGLGERVRLALDEP